ncbi:hypothetical protein LJR289_000423 [Pseudoduganella sp. LjRoot289]|uniref:hypothetical protein n=1 Tax=Pseudoduganella sp. LjRoot289 TaxID=3342314 RepID=UPI003ECDD6C0
MNKRKFLIPLASFIALAGCGGNSSSNPIAPTPSNAIIGGNLTGLPSGLTLLLQNNSSEIVSINANGSFSFGKKIPEGSNYSVAPLVQPSGANCIVSNGTGTVTHGTDSISSIGVTCQSAAVGLANFNVGATVSGLLPGNSVGLLNNGTDKLVVSDNGLFVFSQSYAKQAVYAGRLGGYNVTIQTNPSSQTCTLTNASGELSLSNVSNFVNISVLCK